MTQTQENKSGLPEGWKKVTLWEISKFQYWLWESAQDKWDFLYVRITDINPDWTLKKTDLTYIDKEKVSSNLVLEKWDILVARTWASYGKSYLFKENIKATFWGFLIRLLLNETKIDNYFLFSFMRTNLYWWQANNLVWWWAQPQFNANVITKLEIPLPPLSTQKSIAKILSSFDDKIELLREQNETLEKIWQEIFKEWFGKYKVWDELPEGWKVGKIGEISKLKSWYAFKSKDFVEESKNKAVKIKDLKWNWKVDLIDVSSVSDEIINIDRVQYFKLIAWDLVLAMSWNTTWKIGIIPESELDLYLNQRVWKFFVEDKKYNSFLYFFLMSWNYEEIILNMWYWSAQPNISPSQIENINLIIPDNNKLKDFLEISDDLFKKIIKNNTQIQTLSKTREFILPRLMKWEIII